jgi:hypothetical protein
LIIENIGNSEARISALHISIEYGTPEEKQQALVEVRCLVYQERVTTSAVKNAEVATEATGSEAIYCDTASGDDAEEKSSDSSESSDGSL